MCWARLFVSSLLFTVGGQFEFRVSICVGGFADICCPLRYAAISAAWFAWSQGVADGQLSKPGKKKEDAIGSRPNPTVVSRHCWRQPWCLDSSRSSQSLPPPQYRSRERFALQETCQEHNICLVASGPHARRHRAVSEALVPLQKVTLLEVVVLPRAVRLYQDPILAGSRVAY